nr:hypothetical protein [Rubrivivax sp.]
MDELGANALPQTSPLLWMLSVLIAWLVGHLSIGLVRLARRQAQPSARAWLLALAVLAVGTGGYAAMELALRSEAIAFPIGFDPLALAAGWAVALAAAAALILPGWRLGPASVLTAAALLGGGLVAAAALLIEAIGPLPGVRWRWGTLGTAAAVSMAGIGAGWWIAWLGPGRAGRQRRLWRAAGAALLGAGLAAGQSLVLAAAELSTQIASAYVEHLGALVLTLVSAAAVPLLLGALTLDLHLRDLRERIEADE